MADTGTTPKSQSILAVEVKVAVLPNKKRNAVNE